MDICPQSIGIGVLWAQSMRQKIKHTHERTVDARWNWINPIIRFVQIMKCGWCLIYHPIWYYFGAHIFRLYDLSMKNCPSNRMISIHRSINNNENTTNLLWVRAQLWTNTVHIVQPIKAAIYKTGTERGCWYRDDIHTLLPHTHMDLWALRIMNDLVRW